MSDIAWILSYKGTSGRMYYFVEHKDLPGEREGVDVSSKFLCHARIFNTFDDAVEHERYGKTWVIEQVSKREMFLERLRGRHE